MTRRRRRRTTWGEWGQAASVGLAIGCIGLAIPMLALALLLWLVFDWPFLAAVFIGGLGYLLLTAILSPFDDLVDAWLKRRRRRKSARSKSDIDPAEKP